MVGCFSNVWLFVTPWTQCGKFLERWENQTHLHAGQEATVRTGQGTIDWFQIWKGVLQGCILSPGLFNFYAEYIMRNAGLKETQAGIKIARRNINNFRYADDTTLMAESEEERKSLLMKVKEESEKVHLKLSIQKTKIMAVSPIISCQIDGETMETVRAFIFLGSKITADGDYSHEIKRCLLLGRKAMTNLDSILKSRDITAIISAIPTIHTPQIHILRACLLAIFSNLIYNPSIFWALEFIVFE